MSSTPAIDRAGLVSHNTHLMGQQTSLPLLVTPPRTPNCESHQLTEIGLAGGIGEGGGGDGGGGEEGGGGRGGGDGDAHP